MSRSYKKSPCWAWVCYHSNKKDKKLSNRKLRHKNKQIIRNFGKEKELRLEVFDWEWCDNLPINEKMKFPNSDWYWEFSAAELCNSNFYVMREVADVWTWASDGLAYWQGVPDWRENFPDETEEEYMQRVRNRQTTFYYDEKAQKQPGLFVEYMAKWCHYRWKMK